MWSQDRPKRGALKRYETWKVERITANGRELVREGTLEDATAEYREQDLAPPAFGPVAATDIYGSKRGRASGVRQARGRRGEPSRLAAFAARILKDQ